MSAAFKSIVQILIGVGKLDISGESSRPAAQCAARRSERAEGGASRINAGAAHVGIE